MAGEEPVEIALVRLDSRMASMEASMKRLEGSVSSLAHVDVRVYESEQRAQDRQIESVAKLIADVERRMSERIDSEGKRIDGAEHSNRATLLYLVGIVLVALAGGLVRLALG